MIGHDVSGVGSSSLGNEVGSRREAQNPRFGLTSRELETVLSLCFHTSGVKVTQHLPLGIAGSLI